MMQLLEKANLPYIERSILFMDKKDIRIYFESDYADYLKQIADEQDVSVNHLIVSLVRKKYRLPEKDVTIKLNDDKYVLIKTAAQERNTTISELLISLVDDFLLSDNEPSPDEIPLDAGTGETAYTIPCESGNGQAVDVDIQPYRDELKRIYDVVTEAIEKAQQENGSKIRPVEFFKFWSNELPKIKELLSE